MKKLKEITFFIALFFPCKIRLDAIKAILSKFSKNTNGKVIIIIINFIFFPCKIRLNVSIVAYANFQKHPWQSYYYY